MRTFSRSIWLLTAAWGLAAFAYFGIQGVLLNLYLLRLGFSLEFIGLLIGAGQVMWAAAALPASAVGRRFGFRRAMIAADICMAVGLGSFLIVESLPKALWVPGLFASWLLVWVGASLMAVNSTPYLMRLSSPEQRNHAFTVQVGIQVSMAFAGSVVAGLLPGLLAGWLGATLDDPAPYRFALGLAPPIYALGILCWLGVRPVTQPVEPEARKRGPSPLGLFGLLALVTFLQTAGEGAVRAFFNVYLDTELRVPIAYIGTILGVGQLLALFAILGMPLLLNRKGSPQILALATAGVGLAMLPLALVRHWAPATLGFIGVMAAASMTATARNVFSQEVVPARWHTTSSAVAIIGVGLGWASTAAAGGYVVSRAGFGALFLLSAALAIASAGFLWAYIRVRPRPAPAPDVG